MSEPRVVRRVCLIVASLTLLPLAAACSATGVSAGRVDSAVGPAFSRLYALQQHRLGHDGARTADASATCSRNRAATKGRVTDQGAGDDWLCVVNYPYSDGHIEPVNYDVRVQPTGCYTAQGPSQVVGQQHQHTSAGVVVTNPLFEFDGCFPFT